MQQERDLVPSEPVADLLEAGDGDAGLSGHRQELDDPRRERPLHGIRQPFRHSGIAADFPRKKPAADGLFKRGPLRLHPDSPSGEAFEDVRNDPPVRPRDESHEAGFGQAFPGRDAAALS